VRYCNHQSIAEGKKIKSPFAMLLVNMLKFANIAEKLEK
jgi:hypothetical protein